MISLNINEAKAHLSKYLHAVEAGETVVLCRRNVPVAEIRLLPSKVATTSRPIGLAQDRGEPLPEGFFDELPKEVLAAFAGECK
jgi:antitoxin (DNA-binding transcriptional repressor) of toxin-antitoxin stability system